MAVDEKRARDVRSALEDAKPIREVKMFGGVGLLVRVGHVGEAEALARAYVETLPAGRAGSTTRRKGGQS